MVVKRGPVPVGIYLITPDWADTRRLCNVVAAAIRGGVGAVQYRNKTATGILRREQAFALRHLTRATHTPFFIDDDAVLAMAVGAEGLHIGRDDGDPVAVRAKLASAMTLGVSCYADLTRVVAALAAGAGYVAMGAMFASRTKVGAGIAPLERLRQARDLGAHVVASGGITGENVRLVAAGGAAAAGLVSAVFDAHDPELAARDLVARFAEGALAR